jgi:hypothetical protein
VAVAVEKETDVPAVRVLEIGFVDGEKMDAGVPVARATVELAEFDNEAGAGRARDDGLRNRRAIADGEIGEGVRAVVPLVISATLPGSPRGSRRRMR